MPFPGPPGSPQHSDMVLDERPKQLVKPKLTALDYVLVLEHRFGNGTLPSPYYGTNFFPAIHYSDFRILPNQLINGKDEFVHNQIIRSALYCTHYIMNEEDATQDLTAKVYCDEGPLRDH